MTSSYSNNEQGRKELNEFQRQINQKTDESLESTSRIVDLLAKTEEIGKETIRTLDDQSEKLNQIEDDLNNIGGEMDQAERNLTNLQKFGDSTTAYSSEKSSAATTEPKLGMAGKGMSSSGYITRITNDDRERKMDENLQIASSYLGNLKNIALDMGDTITNQNKQIDRIQQKNETELGRAVDANKRTQDILQSA